MRIDHVVYAVRELTNEPSPLLQLLDVQPVAGGVHGHLGIKTGRLVFGDVAIELATVTDPDIAQQHLWTKWLHYWSLVEPGFLTWAVEVDDIDLVARRLGLDVQEGSTARFRTAGLDEAFEARYLPFFMSPASKSSARSRSSGERSQYIEHIELEGDEQRLRDWLLGDLGRLPVRIEPGEGRIRALSVRDRGKTIVLE